MIGSSIPAPAWGLGGAALTAAAALWQARRQERIESRKSAGTVQTSDASTIFTAAKTNFEQSELLRHDLRDQVDRCQIEISKLKAENDAQREQLREQTSANEAKLTRYRERVESLEDEMFDMSERLRRYETAAAKQVTLAKLLELPSVDEKGDHGTDT